ncbi:hypothetical protein G1H11_20275 [Phytoactinopolyspora alkaliphila]|uniref:2'-5' RNA ligase family protein n=1 Tax=Phytoactinopolyspora alkaliphila TaxID=1783498 RepID=A0A6N9YS53_9ACTN|nr:hypothetical protein [Phytoactinopolyspora alkaliphila]NED97639.1 hypothetical protein [Phytoactinopolyspora alkaliphila]
MTDSRLEAPSNAGTARDHESTGTSVLLVPVAEIEPLVRRQIEENAPEFLCRDSDSVHAHITLLGPFADISIIDRRLLDELTALFATVERFEFRLRHCTGTSRATAACSLGSRSDDPRRATPCLNAVHRKPNNPHSVSGCERMRAAR